MLLKKAWKDVPNQRQTINVTNFEMAGPLESDYTIQMVDQTFGIITLTVLTDEVAAMYNLWEQYGYTDWAKDVPQNINGKSDGYNTVPDIDSIEYNIMKIDGDKMYTGDCYSIEGEDGKTAERRPTTLAMDMCMIRQ